MTGLDVLQVWATAVVVAATALVFVLVGWRFGRESAGRPMFSFGREAAGSGVTGFEGIDPWDEAATPAPPSAGVEPAGFSREEPAGSGETAGPRCEAADPHEWP